MRASQSSTNHILTSIDETILKFGTTILEDIKVYINKKILSLFQEDMCLVTDFSDYIKSLNDVKKLAVLLQSLEDTAGNIKADLSLKKFVKNNSLPLPLVQIFYLFLENIHARTKDDLQEDFDPDIFNLAKVFYTRHVRELACEYTVGYLKQSFICEVMGSCYPQLIEFFYQLGVNCNLTWEKYGNTPLLFLISDARNSEADYLLSLADKYPENKLDVNVRSTTFGTTALHLVVAKGYRDRSAMGQSLKVSNLALAENLIAHGANVNLTLEKKDDIANGMTALHLAAARKDIEFCQLLIKHGADIHIQDSGGDTPLDLLFLDDQEARHLISHCTGNMSCYRQFQPQDASPEKLKIILESYSEEINNKSQSKKLLIR